MKLPNNIATFAELANWVESKNPKLIEVSKKSKLREISEFNPDTYGQTWKYFRAFPIKYLKYL